ncbi:hypothetical protein [Bacteroides sp. 519]|uniref:hypothetical protein n=1 Tax=Bacteroides sp. 519 TaxID=2302937 RepID=UPI0013D17B70|nr:hypothetical protein [Bacteroides sp. 519]NDV58013.1 hypothetical protein [Bacteroides sp. 519]
MKTRLYLFLPIFFLLLACQEREDINLNEKQEIIPLKIDDTKIYFGENEKERQIKIISGNDNYKIIYHKETIGNNNFVVSLEKTIITIKLQTETENIIEEMFLLIDGKEQRKVFTIANQPYYGGINPDGSVVDLDKEFGTRNDIWIFK